MTPPPGARRSGRARKRCRRAAACRTRARQGKTRIGRVASSSEIPSSAEDPALQVLAVDTDAPAGDLRAVQDEIVGLRANAIPVGLQRSMSSSAGDVNGWCIDVKRPSSFLPLEERKIDDPEELERVRPQKAALLRDRQPQLSEQLRSRQACAAGNQQQVELRRRTRRRALHESTLRRPP